MKDYYKQKVETAEEQLRLCEKGFISEMKTIGIGLMNSNDMDSVTEQVEKINRMNTAIGELKQTVASAQKSLQEYLDREGGKE